MVTPHMRHGRQAGRRTDTQVNINKKKSGIPPQKEFWLQAAALALIRIPVCWAALKGLVLPLTLIPVKSFKSPLSLLLFLCPLKHSITLYLTYFIALNSLCSSGLIGLMGILLPQPLSSAEIMWFILSLFLSLPPLPPSLSLSLSPSLPTNTMSVLVSPVPSCIAALCGQTHHPAASQWHTLTELKTQEHKPYDI